MTKANSLSNKEPRKLPSHLDLESFGIKFDSTLLEFETSDGFYRLKEFVDDYYNMEFKDD